MLNYVLQKGWRGIAYELIKTKARSKGSHFIALNDDVTDLEIENFQ